MPELPDILTYLEALRPRVMGQPLLRIRIVSPFVLRSVEPPVAAAEGKRVEALRRLGKRLVLGLEDELFLVIHLMIAGRLRWRDAGAPVPKRLGLAAFDFPTGTLLHTEAGTKKRSSLVVVRGDAALADHDPGGLDVLTADLAAFRRAVTAENHTLKRTLTDPRILDGIGNAYSDEILHAARLSPVKLSGALSDEEVTRLYGATRTTLRDWIARQRADVGEGFPEKVTAFRDGMAVHGRYGRPCPVCGTPVQRIRHASNEVNYCPRCQTGGRLLADRGLSRLLKKDWPKTIDEMESRIERR